MEKEPEQRRSNTAREVEKGHMKTSSKRPEDADALAQGVKRLAMSQAPTPNSSTASMARSTGGANLRVSGLDSFDGSSEASMETGQSVLVSMQERLHTARGKTGSTYERIAIRSPSAAKDISKHKKAKKMLTPEAIAQSFLEIQHDGWKPKMVDGPHARAGGLGEQQDREMGDIPTSDGGHAPINGGIQGKLGSQLVNLMGSHGETRQEK
jgi:hypothetical protein